MEKIALNSLLQYELELLSFDPDFHDYYIDMNGDLLEPNEQKARLAGAIEALELLIYDYSRFQGAFDDIEWKGITLELNKRKLRYLITEFTLCDPVFGALIPFLIQKISNLIIKNENAIN